MRMGNKRKTAVAVFGLWVAAIILPGCGDQPLVEREPKELLRLSVSGLSGVDAYRFSGQSGVKTGERVTDVVRFGGKVEHHDQVRLEEASLNQAEHLTVRDPMAYLKQVQREAKRTAIKQEESNARTTVLVIDADPALARKRWVHALSAAFENAIHAARPIPGHANALSAKTKTEIRTSRAQLDEMLRSLSVDTTYRLMIDRKKLLPNSLTETTVLHYARGGRPYSETRQLTLEMKPEARR